MDNSEEGESDLQMEYVFVKRIKRSNKKIACVTVSRWDDGNVKLCDLKIGKYLQETCKVISKHMVLGVSIKQDSKLVWWVNRFKVIMEKEMIQNIMSVSYIRGYDTPNETKIYKELQRQIEYISPGVFGCVDRANEIATQYVESNYIKAAHLKLTIQIIHPALVSALEAFIGSDQWRVACYKKIEQTLSARLNLKITEWSLVLSERKNGDWSSGTPEQRVLAWLGKIKQRNLNFIDKHIQEDAVNPPEDIDLDIDEGDVAHRNENKKNKKKTMAMKNYDESLKQTAFHIINMPYSLLIEMPLKFRDSISIARQRLFADDGQCRMRFLVTEWWKVVEREKNYWLWMDDAHKRLKNFCVSGGGSGEALCREKMLSQLIQNHSSPFEDEDVDFPLCIRDDYIIRKKDDKNEKWLLEFFQFLVTSLPTRLSMVQNKELDNCDPDQRGVLESENSLIVLHGGPGSGKTWTLINFIRYQRQVGPVFVLTPTHKAKVNILRHFENDHEGIHFDTIQMFALGNLPCKPNMPSMYVLPLESTVVNAADCAEALDEDSPLLVTSNGVSTNTIENTNNNESLTPYASIRVERPEIRQERWNCAQITVVIDECAMVSLSDFTRSLRQINFKFGVDKLWIVGDPHQLPPIQIGDPFSWISKKFPSHVHRLLGNHRSGTLSDLDQTISQIKEGVYVTRDSETGSELSSVIHIELQWSSPFSLTRLREKLLLDVLGLPDMTICLKKVDVLKLNRIFVAFDAKSKNVIPLINHDVLVDDVNGNRIIFGKLLTLAPSETGGPLMVQCEHDDKFIEVGVNQLYPSVVKNNGKLDLDQIYIGMRVIIIRNIFLKQTLPKILLAANNSTGKIISINPLLVSLDDCNENSHVEVTVDDIGSGLVRTVHTCQGGEAPNVMFLHDNWDKYGDRSLFYTAVSRTKRNIRIVGRERMLSDLAARPRFQCLSSPRWGKSKIIKRLLTESSCSDCKRICY